MTASFCLLDALIYARFGVSIAFPKLVLELQKGCWDWKGPFFARRKKLGDLNMHSRQEEMSPSGPSTYHLFPRLECEKVFERVSPIKFWDLLLQFQG